MASKYNFYPDVENVYNAKVEWNQATTDKERKKANEKANIARQNLITNGYADIANEISASGADATKARQILDKYGKENKTATRPYLYSLGKQYGMSEQDVDKLIGWDNDTGQLSLGGKVVGTPDSVVDGVSYWGDTSVLDNAFNDYIKRSGTTVSDSLLQSQHNTEARQKVNELWGIQNSDREAMAGRYNRLEETAYSNPFETAEAKAILAKYDLAGMQGRDNAIASGGASNGGNIDSYAAANAMRQQASLTNQGQMAVLDAHNNKINNVKGILESLGVYQQNQDKGMQNTIGIQQTEAQRLFENDQTAKNNDVARKKEIASVIGYSPDEWIVSNNPYMNDDGTIKDKYKNIDFSAVMAKAKTAGNTKAYNAAATARYYKIMGDYGAYGQYDDGNYIVPGAQRTEEGRQFDVNNDTVLKTLETNSADNKYATDAAMADNAAQRSHEITKLELEGNNNESQKPFEWTDEGIEVAQIIIDNINEELKGEKYLKSNPNGEDIIKYEGRGKWTLNLTNNTKKTTWKWQILKPIMLSKTLTEDEMAAIVESLGYSWDEGIEVYEAFKDSINN